MTLNRNRHHRADHPNRPKSNGFTLVELIVSMAMASVLMLGLSTFFASTFHNLFQAQSDNAATERQFAVNQILEDKFASMDQLLAMNGAKDSVLLFNKKNNGQLPFTLIGTQSVGGGVAEKYLAFKDLLIFNKILPVDESGKKYYYGFWDGANGRIARAGGGGDSAKVVGDPYFGGFDKNGSCFYVAQPNLNKVEAYPSTCVQLSMGAYKLDNPMDVVFSTNKNYLYISDSGNGRILRYDFNAKSISEILTKDLSYPTGLAYYEKTVGSVTNQFLFVSDTFGNKVKRVDLTDPNSIKVVTVAGDGDDETCNSTARFCKLNMPTGLSIDTLTDPTNPTLFIADSGKGRGLKVVDPGRSTTLNLGFSLANSFALDKIELEGDWTNGIFGNSNLTGEGGDYSNKIFKNSDQFSVFSNPNYKYGGAGCVSSGQTLYVIEPPPVYLKKKMVLKYGGTPNATITVRDEENPITTVSCVDNTTDPPISTTVTKINLDLASNLGTITTNTGDPVYPSNPTSVSLALTTVDWANFTGFKTTTIKTYDLKNGLVDTDYVTVRLGDGFLGSAEDTISEVRTGLGFPTGVSDFFVADTVNKTILKMQLPYDLTIPLNNFVLSLKDLTPDYVTDFTIDSVNFSQPTNPKLLEMELKIPPNQSYTHTAVLSP
jgi:prepilin-type N-terminal cleavage/methylation domain-containing protein